MIVNEIHQTIGSLFPSLMMDAFNTTDKDYDIKRKIH